MTTSRPTLALVLVLLGVLGLAARAGAEPPADLTAYDNALKQAVDAHREQRWLDAHALFEKAHGLYPNARTLRGLGISAFEAGKHALSLSYLEAAMVHPERPLPPEVRDSVEVLASHLRQQVGVYVFRLQPEGAALQVDDGPPIVSPKGEVLLDPGSHRAVVSLEGYVTQTVELDAHGGDRSEMRVSLMPVPVTPPATTQGRVEPLPLRPLAPRADESPRWTPLRVSGLAAASAGVLSFGITGALSGTARARIRDIADECDAQLGCTNSQALKLERDRDVPRLERGMTATLSVGAGLVVASVVLWVLDARSRRQSAQRAWLEPGVVRF